MLRAGLTNILKDKDIHYHYWEAVPTHPEESLLRAIRESWNSQQRLGAPTAAGEPSSPEAGGPVPESLDDLVNPSGELCPRRQVIVLDQFEQLAGRSQSQCPIFRLLRKVARQARPPYRVLWIVAFRREFRADWSDFLIPEQKRGFFPAEMSLKLFSQPQAQNVAKRLVDEAGLLVEERVVDTLVAAATVECEVSPVDIGIGLMILAELCNRLARTITIDDYHFAGGAEGLLTEYIR